MKFLNTTLVDTRYMCAAFIHVCGVMWLLVPAFVCAQEIERYSDPSEAVIDRVNAADIKKLKEEEEKEGIYREDQETPEASSSPTEAGAEQASEDQQEAVAEDDDVETSEGEEVPEEEVVTFNIWEYRVEGNNVLGRDLIERAVYPYLGPDKSIETVEEARSALEKAYHEEGFGTVFIDIPEQDVEGGVVTLNVTEGKIDRVRITGSRYYALGKIKERAPALGEGSVPNLPELQEQIALLNKGAPGREIAPVLKPGRLPGTVEVELKVEDKHPLKGSWVKLNDRYSIGTSILRVDANLQYHNLWQMGHDASIGYIVSPQEPSEVQVIAGTYVIRFPGSDHVVALYGVDTSSDIVSIGDINTVGTGTILGGTAVFNLQQMGIFSQSVTLSGSYKDFGETSTAPAGAILDRPISYLSFSGGYIARWVKEGSYSTRLSLTGNIAPRTFGNSAIEFENKRAGSKPNFSYLNLSFLHKHDWIYGSELHFRAKGQISDSPLINTEQFTLGGYTTVRGYLEAQELADDGWVATVEIRSPSIEQHIAKYLEEEIAKYINEFRFLAFFDGARARIQEPLPEQNRNISLASTGVGIRMRALNDSVIADVQWAVALNEVDDINQGDSRIHFELGYKF